MDKIQPIGIPHFNELFKGGMPHGSTVLVAGPSGAGKTMFCVHWLFAGYKECNEEGLYISLTEPVNKLISHQSKNSFYDEQAVQDNKIQFRDLRTVLEDHELDNKTLNKEDIRMIVDKIGNMVLDCGAERVIVDSITALCYRLQTPDLIRHFIFTLGTTLAYLDATVLLTSEVTDTLNSVFGTEEFICDGILRFNYKQNGQRSFRIIKLRGHEYDDTETEFTITNHGLQLYPNKTISRTYSVSSEQLPTGMSGLDTMTNGGYHQGNSIVISGPSGSGKTMIALHGIQAALQAGKKVLYTTFGQSEAEILNTTTAFSWNWQEALQSGQLKIVSNNPIAPYLSAHVQQIEESMTANNWHMVVVDSLNALCSHYADQDFFKAYERLSAFCKHRQVTLLGTTNENELIPNEGKPVAVNIAALCDAIIVLKFIEADGDLRHGVWIVKMRGGEHAKTMMELTITSHGALVTDGFSGYDGVLTGSAHKATTGEQDKIQSLFLEEFGAEGEGLFMEQKAVGLQFSDIQAFSESLKNAGIFNEDEQSKFLERAKEILE